MRILRFHWVMQVIIGLMAGGCLAQPPVAKITLHVVNQDGQPVSDTEIEAGFFIDDGNMPQFKKWPDKNGYVSFESPVLTDAGFIVIRVMLPGGILMWSTTAMEPLFDMIFKTYHEHVKSG